MKLRNKMRNRGYRDKIKQGCSEYDGVPFEERYETFSHS